MTSSEHPLGAKIRILSSAHHPGVILDDQGTILFVNDAWDAGADAGPLVGSRWMDHLAGAELRRHYEELFQRALRHSGAGSRSLLQVTESNTPERARLVAGRFEQILTPHGGVLGVALTFEPIRGAPIDDVYPVITGDARDYRKEDGRIVQCACCRRTARSGAADGSWDFVPGLLDLQPGIEWEFCSFCRSLHFPELAAAEPAEV